MRPSAGALLQRKEPGASSLERKEVAFLRTVVKFVDYCDQDPSPSSPSVSERVKAARRQAVKLRTAVRAWGMALSQKGGKVDPAVLDLVKDLRVETQVGLATEVRTPRLTDTGLGGTASRPLLQASVTPGAAAYLALDGQALADAPEVAFQDLVPSLANALRAGQLSFPWKRLFIAPERAAAMMAALRTYEANWTTVRCTPHNVRFEARGANGRLLFPLLFQDGYLGIQHDKAGEREGAGTTGERCCLT